MLSSEDLTGSWAAAWDGELVYAARMCLLWVRGGREGRGHGHSHRTVGVWGAGSCRVCSASGRTRALAGSAAWRPRPIRQCGPPAPRAARQLRQAL